MYEHREVTETVVVVVREDVVIVSDATGHDLKPGSGFAIVRLRDGEELAHFQSLFDLEDTGRCLSLKRAAVDQSERIRKP